MEHQKSSSRNTQPINNFASTPSGATVPPPKQANVSTAVKQNASHPADHQLAEPSVSPPQHGDPQWRSAVIMEYSSYMEAKHITFSKAVKEEIAVKDYIS
ncbi:unnamed protein product [Orchesella dallaii]|uniref:Uncharacterized protein n=1 Tax=Orchesella dallaii TaxID=48710 RepID=A0ABP1RY35_9HEXA